MSEHHKICPLMSMGRMVPVNCAKEQCEWYVKVEEQRATDYNYSNPGYQGCAITFLHDIMLAAGMRG